MQMKITLGDVYGLFVKRLTVSRNVTKQTSEVYSVGNRIFFLTYSPQANPLISAILLKTAQICPRNI
jgi:hypothetical protein